MKIIIRIGVMITALLVNPWCLAASLPFPPDFSSDATPQVRSEQSLAIIGHIRALAGEVYLQDRNGEPISVTTGTAVKQGDGMRLSGNARIRIVYNNGDYMDITDRAQLAFFGNPRQGLRIHLWEGRVVAFILPSLLKTRSLVTIVTDQGDVKTVAGKFSIEAGDGGSLVLSVLDNRVVLDKGDESIVVATGSRYTSTLMGGKLDRMIRAQELKLTMAASPEAAMIEIGLEAYAAGDKESAEQQFKATQAAFPNSLLAAYYLGQIALENDRMADAVQQWQLYASLDPQGAKDKGVNKHLTLLVAKQLEEEIAAALQQENQFSSLKPEPDSVAVSALASKGAMDPRFEAISKGLTAMIISDLSKVPSLKVLERMRVQKLMDEINLGNNSLVGKATAARAGKMLRAEKLITGSYNTAP